MTEITQTETKDWAASARSLVVIWGLPLIAVVAGTFVGPMVRTVIWSIALLWMGGACLMNARRCGRVHCRYTGPFYLALIAPVIVQGAGLVSFGAYGWWIIGAMILLGGKIIWWVTETRWGRYSG